MDDYICIGKFGKSHGYKGELGVLFFINTEGFNNIEAFFIAENGKPLPYFVESLYNTPDGKNYLKIKGIDTKEAAQQICGEQIFLPSTQIHIKESSDSYGYLQGYMAYDQQFGKIGIIKSILEMPGQEIAQIIRNTKEILLPVAIETIKCVDNTRKVVLFSLADGLVEAYIETK